MTIDRVGGLAVLLGNGKVLISGGTSSSDPIASDIYDPVAGKFSPGGNMTTERAQAAAAGIR